MYIGRGGFHGNHGATSNRGTETHAGTHESFSVTLSESISQTGRPGTDRSNTTATNSTWTHAMRAVGRPGWNGLRERRFL